MADALERARQILTLESDAIKNIPLDNSLERAIDLIVGCRGKVITSGMGKAGIIAKKISSTFSSTGTPSFYLHPGEAQHGDLGMVGKEDILIVLSNSGKTREIIELVELTKRMLGSRLPLITITSHPESDLKRNSAVLLNIGNVTEACALGMAPTTSTTAMLALGDVLCVLTMERIKFTMKEYSKRHHGGYLGEKARNHE